MSGTGQDQLFRARQVHFVADTDKDWLHTGPGADHAADALMVYMKRTDRAPHRCRFPELTDQSAFSAAYRRQTGEDSDMTGDPETARMGDALTVTDKDVGDLFKFAQGGDKGRGLAEGEQTWYIGEGQGSDGALLLQDLLFFYVPQHDAADAQSMVRSEGGIDSSDPGRWFTGRAGADNQRGQSFLDRDGLAWGQGPIVRWTRDFHGTRPTAVIS